MLTPRNTDENATANRARAIGIATLVLAITPAVAAIWYVPTFVTQDGPAHLYNAQVLARSFDPDSPFRPYFSVRWQPLPNWAGHLALMGLASTFPPRVADRLMTSATFLLFVCATAWLRYRVVGWRGMPLSAHFAGLLGLNVAWLFGFTSFLLGAALFPITLWVWWDGRDRDERLARRSLGLAALMVLGYFCHLISLGLTALGLVVLEASTPGRNRRSRALCTGVGLLPLIPLGALYLSVMRQGGGIGPEWKHLGHFASPIGWVRQLSWVDPISIARRDVAPLLDIPASRWLAVCAPVGWFLLSLGLLAVSSVLAKRVWVPLVVLDQRAAMAEDTGRVRPVAPVYSDQELASNSGGDSQRIPNRVTNSSTIRGWWILAALLLIGGIVAPDTLGASHGEYLQQRIVLLGLVALVPLLPAEPSRTRLGRLALIAMAVAWLLQTAFVWDYAFTSERTAGAIARASPVVGTRQRVIVMLSRTRVKFRANPLIHADGLLGAGSENILWNNYETRHYYFPVRFREGLRHPDPFELEQISLSEQPDRAARWERVLEQYHDLADVIVVWGVDPAIDAVTEKWFTPVFRAGKVRVYRP
jgi:hypothetical protein